MDYAETMLRFSRVAGLTGQETAAAHLAVELLRPLTDEAYIDKMGNAIGIKRCGKPNAPKLMLDAHIDQVGFYVNDYAENGFFKVGEEGMDLRLAPGLPVRVICRDGKELPGVLTCGEGEGRGKAVPLDKLYLDVGLDEKTAKELVHLNDMVICDCRPFQTETGLIYTPAVDDRGCFAVLLDVLEKLQGKELNADIIIQGAGREEVGGPNAENSAAAIMPDLFFAVDVCHAKYPGNPTGEVFGTGPSIARQGTSKKQVTQKLFALAKEHDIPVNDYLIAYISGTNAGHAELAAKGIPCGVMSLPIRYMHAPYEVVCIKDMEAMAQLLYWYALDFNGFEEGAQ